MSQATCVVPACPSPAVSRSMCSKHYQRSRRGVSLEPATAKCGHCGTDFTPKRSNSRYCSKSCGDAASYRRSKQGRKPGPRLPPMECAKCATVFDPVRKDGRFCSRRCLRAAYLDSSATPCSYCDRPMRARGMCSMHYRRWRRAEGLEEVPQWTPERRAQWKAREELKRTSVVEPIVNAEIFERDGWVCQLCDAPVDCLLSYPDPGSASLDHIMPLSRGGHHVRSNVQLAHLFCNLSKGARAA